MSNCKHKGCGCKMHKIIKKVFKTSHSSFDFYYLGQRKTLKCLLNSFHASLFVYLFTESSESHKKSFSVSFLYHMMSHLGVK